LGYTRYWLSEHHNTGTLAGAAPEVLIARLAAETERIRFGSGGIMLPNHSALKVAENFKLLEALYPGRIDLGVGRAPGGDRLTASILNPSNDFNPNNYIRQIAELTGFLTGSSEAGTIHEKVKAIPDIDSVPELWILTSSGERAYIAAHFGMSLSYALFINPMGGPEAIRIYREKFRPNKLLLQPQVSVGVFAFCGDTVEKAERVQAVMDYRLLAIEKGMREEAPSYESVKSYQYTREELSRVTFNRMRMVTGTPDTIKEKLEDIARRFTVDEIMVATFADTLEDRLRSYELLAETFQINVSTAV
jgi:luciferase family oxidoreductase group 1